MSLLPSGQCEAIACFSTSLGLLKAFMQPCHSHRNGSAGFGFGTLVTLNDDGTVTVADVVVIVVVPDGEVEAAAT